MFGSRPDIRSWIFLLASALALAGCRREDRPQRRPVVVAEVVDHASGTPEGLRFGVDDARRELVQALEDSATLRPGEEGEPGAYRAELILTLATEREPSASEDQPEGGPEDRAVYRAVQVNLGLSRWGQGPEREKLSTEGKAFQVQDPESVGRQEGFEAVLGLAIRQAVQNADLQVQTRALPLSRQEELLSSESADTRLNVLRALRERPAPELVPRVIALLQDPDPEVALEAIGVLVAARDPRAAEPLIRAGQGRDHVFLLQNISALSEIGGPVARGFLFTLAAGHSSPVIRERANEALRQLESGDEEPPEKAAAIPSVRHDADGQ